MPRPLPTIHADVAPLEVTADADALRYVRATELLRLARSRRDARLRAEAEAHEAAHKNKPQRANAGASH